MAGFGGSVKLTGESEYKKALQSIRTSLREVSSEMKLVSAQFQSSNKDTNALTTKSEELSKKLTAQKQAINDLKNSYSQMEKQYAAQTKKTETLQKSLDSEKAKLEEIKKSLGTSSTAYQEQAKVVDKLEEELKQSKTAQDGMANSLTKMRTDINNAEASIVKTENSLDDLNGKLNKTSDELDDVGKGAEEATGGFTVFKGALADLVSNVIQNAISKLKDLASETIEVGASFDSSMAKVGAVSGATGKDLEALRNKAKEMGATTKFSATQSAEALNYMAMAGWKTDNMLKGLNGVMNLAAASGADLATTSDIVTDALTGFGVGAEEAGRLADIMAAASSNANTNVEMMGETFKYVTPIAGAMGYSMEDTALAIGLMSNAGIKSSQAGTSLRYIITRLSTDAGASSKKLGALGTLTKELGVEFYNTDGSARDLADVLADTRKAWAGLSEEQQTNYGKTIAGQNALSGFLAIMNASEEDFNKLSGAINNSTGAAEKMATQMQDNLGGDMTILKSQIEGVQIALYEKLEPALRKGVAALSKLTDAMGWLVEHGNEVAAVITGIATATAVYVGYTTAIKVMTQGWASLTIVTKAQAVAQAALNAVMSANPIGIVIGLIAGLVAAFVVLWNKSESFRKFWINLWNAILLVVDLSVKGVISAFTKAWDTIKGVWNGATAFFSGIFNGIKSVFSAIPTFFSTVFSQAWQAVKNVFSSWGAFFSGLWNTIKTTFSNLGTNIANAIGGAVKSGINGVISTIEKTINGAIGLINGAIKLINKIPAVNVGTLSNLKLPRLAKGGIVDSPTLAQVGENGREAIIPLENNKGWIKELAAELKNTMTTPLTEFTKATQSNTLTYTLYTELVSAFKGALSQMKVELDDEEVGKFIEKTVANAIYT